MTAPPLPAPAGALTRSGTLPVVEAVAALDAAESAGVFRFDTTAVEDDPRVLPALAAAQVGWADLAEMARITDHWAVTGMLVGVTVTWLDQVAQFYPAMAVRDAFAWVRIEREGDATVSTRPEGWVEVVVGPWAQVGLSETGWAYALAGYAPAEARAGLDAGALTQDDARAIAAMRGAYLPG